MTRRRATSPGPLTDAARRLREVRRGLLRLHKALVDAERAAYERDRGRLLSSGEALQLLIHDPWFAWLRPLSELIVRIDEALGAEAPPTAEGADALAGEARALVAPAEGGAGLGPRYLAALQAAPDAILARRDVTKLL